MRSIVRATLLIAVVLLVPVVPFLVMGEQFEAWVERILATELSQATRFGIIVAALASDILLPIPSSAVSTYGGGILGTWPATAASWLGMTLGASLAFGLARLFGDRFAQRWAKSNDLERMSVLTRKYGPLALVLTRALPILAEACVLLMGATRLSWRRFFIPVTVANFAVSLTYASFGQYFQGRDALPAAVVASAAIPLVLALLLRHWLPHSEGDDDPATDVEP